MHWYWTYAICSLIAILFVIFSAYRKHLVEEYATWQELRKTSPSDEYTVGEFYLLQFAVSGVVVIVSVIMALIWPISVLAVTFYLMGVWNLPKDKKTSNNSHTKG